MDDLLVRMLDAGLAPVWIVLAFSMWRNYRDTVVWRKLWQDDLEAKAKIAEAIRQLRAAMQHRRGDEGEG